MCGSQDEYLEMVDFLKTCSSMEPSYDKNAGYMKTDRYELMYVTYENKTQYISVNSERENYYDDKKADFNYIPQKPVISRLVVPWDTSGWYHVLSDLSEGSQNIAVLMSE